jgi:hypothetical protein
VLQIDATERPDIAELGRWLQQQRQTSCRALWEGLDIDGELTVMLWVGPPSDVGQDFVIRIPLVTWRSELQAAANCGQIGISPEALRFGPTKLLEGRWFYLRPPMETLKQMLEATALGDSPPPEKR